MIQMGLSSMLLLEMKEPWREQGGWGRQLLRGPLFRPLGSDKSAILFTAIGSLHSQSIDFTTPNPVMPCRSMAFDELAWCRG